MNSTAQQVHDLLRNAKAPTFANPDHQAKLLPLLLERHSEDAEGTTARSPWFRQRMVWMAAAALLLVAIGMPLRGLLAPTRVWAEVLTALERVDSFVMTTTLYRDGAPDQESIDFAAFYFREGTGLALHTSREKVWNVNNHMYRYNEKTNEVLIIRGLETPPVKSCFGETRLLTGGWGVEQDHGAVVRDGKTYRLLEVVDENDPTERVEVFYEPGSMLPLIVLVYRRNTRDKPWRMTRQDTIDYNVEIDDEVFVPAYPDTAKVTDRAPNAMEMTVIGARGDSARDDAWMAQTAAIVYDGEKYLAVEHVWMSPSGWIGLKLRTNLYDPFTIPIGFSKDPVNHERWDADQFMLHNLAGGTLLMAEPGVRYLSFNGSTHTRYPDDTQGYAYFYHPLREEFPADDFQPKQLLFRTIAIVRDRGRGESMAHYWDWKIEPEKWRMLELTIPVPEPSLTPPASFTEEDLAWMQRTRVEERAVQNHLVAMRNKGQDQEAYETIQEQPEAAQRLYGQIWLFLLRDLGKADEAYALFKDAPDDDKLRAGVAWIAVLYELKKEEEAKEFFEQYKEYCTKEYGANAHLDIDAAESYMKRFAD